MKIIGQTTNGFILEASVDEAHRITGKSGKHSDGAQSLNIGTVINVHDIWNHYHSIVTQPMIMSKAAESLRAAATVLENMPDVTK